MSMRWHSDDLCVCARALSFAHLIDVFSAGTFTASGTLLVNFGSFAPPTTLTAVLTAGNPIRGHFS